jgi:hypothetical protein
MGEPAGLYPGPQTDVPAAHRAAGMDLVRAIGPLDVGGRPDPAGRFAFVSIGMSTRRRSSAPSCP